MTRATREHAKTRERTSGHHPSKAKMPAQSPLSARERASSLWLPVVRPLVNVVASIFVHFRRCAEIYWEIAATRLHHTHALHAGARAATATIMGGTLSSPLGAAHRTPHPTHHGSHHGSHHGGSHHQQQQRPAVTHSTSVCNHLFSPSGTCGVVRGKRRTRKS